MLGANRELWERLEGFDLDEAGASLTFTRRLARENGWSHDFARRVVAEYKRFVFLARTAGHQVTPSDEVDQAWHLHLTYTRSYWNDLCGGVLGRPLHHGPTKGGPDEGARFEDQYEQTLASYREAFDEEAPVDIWPPSEVRFGEAQDFVRVNTRRVWMIRKSACRPPAVAAGLVGITMFGQAAAAERGGFGVVFGVIGAFVGVFLLSFLIAMFAGGRTTKGGRRRGSGGGGAGGAGFGVADSNPGANDHGDGFFGGFFGGGDSGCGASGCGGGGCGGGCGGD